MLSKLITLTKSTAKQSSSSDFVDWNIFPYSLNHPTPTPLTHTLALVWQAIRVHLLKVLWLERHWDWFPIKMIKLFSLKNQKKDSDVGDGRNAQKRSSPAHLRVTKGKSVLTQNCNFIMLIMILNLLLSALHLSFAQTLTNWPYPRLARSNFRIQTICSTSNWPSSRTRFCFLPFKSILNRSLQLIIKSLVLI